MYSSAYVWAKVLNHMEDHLGSVTVSAWFDDAEVVELNEEHLILYSSSDFRRDIIRRRCGDRRRASAGIALFITIIRCMPI